MKFGSASLKRILAVAIALVLVVMGACFSAPGTTGAPSIDTVMIQVIAPSGTVSPTISPTATISPSPTVTISPSPTAGASPTPAVVPAADVKVTLQVSGLSMSTATANTAGRGRIHYYMDVIPPVGANQPATTAAGTFAATTDNTYTWMNVPAGLHVFSAELVNNDSTPLDPPVTAAAMITINAGGGVSPTATLSPSPTVTISPSPTPLGAGLPAFTSVGASILGAVSPSPTVTMIPSPTVTLTPSPTATVSPSPTVTASPGAAGARDVTVSVQVANLRLVDKLGMANVAGEGHIHYFMDVVPPTNPNLPAVTAAGTYAATAATSYTWRNVSVGTHMFSVELVDNDHTALSTPVTATLIIMIAGPAATATATIPTATASPTASGAISLTAQNNAFDQSTITVRAGQPVTINFNNMDSGVPHNFAVYTDSSATSSIFIGQIVTGPTTTTYSFTAPSTPGSYLFRCDVHPSQMTGTLVVQ